MAFNITDDLCSGLLCGFGNVPHKASDCPSRLTYSRGVPVNGGRPFSTREDTPAAKPEGGRNDDAGKPGFEFLPGDALGEINEIMRFGAEKYAPRNWEKGMAWTRPANACLRHLFAWLAGEHKDPETGRSHLAHAGACILFLLSYEKRGIGQDDRAPTLTDQTWADDAVARAKAMKAVVPGPCAKQVVKATILTKSGARYAGFNHCCKPQKTCPRDAAGFKTGEGYELCKIVCEQVGHAEEVAIEAAEVFGADLQGAVLFLEGHTYACEKCENSALLRGIEIVIGAPPK